MRLVYKNDGKEVRVGDETSKGKVEYFKPPTSPASSGKVLVREEGGVREYYVGIINAEWVEREDRV
jgi:hypothetical protein